MANPIGSFETPVKPAATKPAAKPGAKPDASQVISSLQQSTSDQAKQLESEVTPMPKPPAQQQGQAGGVDLKAHVELFSFMMLLSALSARSTSAPLTAAMNNMTASLKGMQSGNATIQQQQNAEMWKNYDAAMEQHKASLEKYKIGLDAMYKDTKNGPQKLYMELLEAGYDPKMASELSSPANAAKLYDSMLKGSQKIHEEADKVKHWQQVEHDKKVFQFEKEISSLELKKAAATTDAQKKSYDEQISMVKMRRDNALGGAGVSATPSQPAGGKPTPTAEDIAYAKSHPETAAQFKAHFGVEPL